MKKLTVKYLAVALAVAALALAGASLSGALGVTGTTPTFAQDKWNPAPLRAALAPQVSPAANNESVTISWNTVTDQNANPPFAEGQLPSEIWVLRSPSPVHEGDSVGTLRRFTNNKTSVVRQSVTDSGVEPGETYNYSLLVIYPDPEAETTSSVHLRLNPSVTIPSSSDTPEDPPPTTPPPTEEPQSTWNLEDFRAALNPRVSVISGKEAIRVQWNQVADEDVQPPAADGNPPSHFAVLRKGEDDSDFREVIRMPFYAGAPNQTVSDYGARAGVTYEYVLKVIYEYPDDSISFSVQVGTTPSSIMIPRPWDESVLREALNPKVFRISENRGIRVRWYAVTKAKVNPPEAGGELPSHFLVERTPEAGYYPIVRYSNPSDGRMLKFADLTPYPGQPYTYQLRVVYPNGHERLLTLEPSWKLTMRMSLGQTAVRSGDEVTISWNAATWRPQWYQVWRFAIETDENGNPSFGEVKMLERVRHRSSIANYSITDDSATDDTVQYHYRITAKIPSGEKAGKYARTRYFQASEGAQ